MQAEADLTPRSGPLTLFITGFVQVLFVGLNTVFIAEYHVLGNLLTAFGISMIWTYNVKRVAFGGKWDRIAYAVGAALGSVTGSMLAHTIT